MRLLCGESLDPTEGGTILITEPGDANSPQAMLYAETSNCVTFKPNSIHVTYTQAADVMGLDRSTVSCLELLQNSRHVRQGPTTTTLFGILNHTLTPQGRRLLRCALLQPSTDTKLITERWDAVQELSSSQDFFTDVRGALQKLLRIDIEHVMASVSTNTRRVLGFTLLTFLTPGLIDGQAVA